MAKLQRRWAVKARMDLVIQLGGVCAFCGSKHDLQIDHIHGRNYSLRKLSSDHRVSIYRREAQAGLLQVLCGPCNNSKH